MRFDLFDGDTLVNRVNATQETVDAGFFDPLVAVKVEPEKPTPPSVPVLPMVDVVVSSGVGDIQPSGTKYYLPPGEVFGLSARIDGGDSINIDVVKLVAQECADDQPNGKEFYITASIVGGVVSGSFEFPVSTNYKVTAERNNRALDRMFGDAPFHLSFDTLDFLS